MAARWMKYGPPEKQIISITQQPNTRATVIALHANVIIFMFGFFNKRKTKTGFLGINEQYI